MGTADPNKAYASLLIFSSALVAALVFIVSAWKGTRYANSFWLIHAIFANGALFFALRNLAWIEIWPLPVMAAASALLYWNLRPLYLEALGIVPVKIQAGKGSKDAPKFQNPAQSPRYTFADVVGMDHLKERLGEVVFEIKTAFEAQEKAEKKSWRKGLNKGKEIKDEAGNGILLFGEPGNGKTFFAEALAGELRLPIITTTFGDVASKWVGETTEQVMGAFDDAEAQAPCVLFMDEIDSLLIKRDKASSTDSEAPKTVNAVLTRLVQLRTKGVIVIAATNFIDRLDTAAIREGRFDYKIEIPPPDLPARIALIQRTLSTHRGGVPFEEEGVHRAAKRYDRFSVARITSIAAEAANLVVKGRAESTTVTFSVLQQALRNLQGTLGVRLTEKDPTLEDLVMPALMGRTLNGIATRMIDIEKTESMGGTVPTGILFYGPPGTGKTLTVKALAKTTGWALLITSGQDLQARLEQIDEIMMQASQLRPCIVFIDEADDVLGHRRASTASASLTNKILTVIDGAGGRVPDVVWVAATNHPDTLDSAALRGGRFTEKIEFSLPDTDTLEVFIKNWLAKSKAKVAPDIAPEEIAETLGKVSYANAEAVMQSAVNHMISRSQPGDPMLVNREDVADACQTVLGLQLAARAVRARYTFADVVGMDELKERMREAINEIKAAFQANARAKGKGKDIQTKDAPNGILLFGDPGNGKTFFAEALAGELELPMITATFGDVVSKWVGETTEKVMAAFNDAEQRAPCVLFLDEIDALLIKRDKSTQADSEGPKTVNAVLTRLVQARSKGVVIIAATNFIDRLDTAAIREGRFDYKIEIPPPDLPAREALIRRVLSTHRGGVKFDAQAIERAARRYEGFSVARVTAIATEAANLVSKRRVDSKSVTFPVLQQALRNLQGTLGVRLAETDPTIDELVLSAEMRRLLQGIATRMIDIEEMESMGGTVPKGVLFYGPPGTGKTSAVKALAKTTGWALLIMSGQELQGRPDKIDEVVAQASSLRPCIVFIDEADDVLADRRSTPWSASLTNKLLTAIDGATGRAPDVVWVAATNHPDALDSAALRGGRFTEKIQFSLPDMETLEIFIETWLARSKAQIASDVTAREIAEMLGSVSFANAEAVMQTAVNHMLGRCEPNEPQEVNLEDVASGCRTVLEI
jgi:transitional endoplasmic reticulum ATPase